MKNFEDFKGILGKIDTLYREKDRKIDFPECPNRKILEIMISSCLKRKNYVCCKMRSSFCANPRCEKCHKFGYLFCLYYSLFQIFSLIFITNYWEKSILSWSCHNLNNCLSIVSLFVLQFVIYFSVRWWSHCFRVCEREIFISNGNTKSSDDIHANFYNSTIIK